MKHLRLRAIAFAVAAGMLLSLAACEDREPQERTINLDLRGGEVAGGDATWRVDQGDEVTLIVTSDQPVNFHLHGYDFEQDVEPGKPAEFAFTANATGSFPITIHHAAVAVGVDDHDAGQASTVEATEGMSVRVEASPDSVSGLNIRLTTPNFTFTAGDAGGEHVPGQGHAHIYVDGVKLGRVYGEHYHIGHIEPGEHTLRVSLNANDHTEYTIDGSLVEDVITVVAPEAGADHHSDAAGGETVEAPDGMSVSLDAVEDSVGGFNLRIDTTGFTFAPEEVGGEHVQGHGHAHIYVDGEKVARVYGPDYHLDGIAAGEHTIRVVLNTNGHQEYAVGASVVEDSVTVVVAPDAAGSGDGGHSHGDGSDATVEKELGRFEVFP